MQPVSAVKNEEEPYFAAIPSPPKMMRRLMGAAKLCPTHKVLG